MKILALIKLLETRKKQFGNIEVVDDLDISQMTLRTTKKIIL